MNTKNRNLRKANLCESTKRTINRIASKLPLSYNQIVIPLFVFFVFFRFSLIAQNIGINSTGAAGNARAMLDIDQPGRGLLIPRMVKAERDTITSIPTSLLIYQTDNTPGFYYYNGTAWVPLLTNSTTNGGWALTGNSGTTVGTNFLGTTDAQDFALYTNNAERIRVTSGGNMCIGITSPVNASRLSVANTTLGNNVFIEAVGNQNTVGGSIAGLSFHNMQSTRGDKIIAQISAIATSPFDAEAGRLNFNTADIAGSVPIRMTIDETGKVGIGTTSPTAPLHVSATNDVAKFQSIGTNAEMLRLSNTAAGGQDWIFEIGTTANPPAGDFKIRKGGSNGEFWIDDATGNVGIGDFGVSGPGAKFHLLAGSGVPVIYQKNAVFTGNFYQVFKNSAGSDIAYFGYTGSGSDDFVVQNLIAGKMSLWTTGGGLTLDNSGNVGIGATNPQARLDLAVVNGVVPRLRFTRQTDGPGINYGLIEFVDNVPTVNYAIGVGQFDQQLHLYQGGTSSANAKLTVSSNGNVGIGQTAPTQKLHVEGNICYTGSIGACSDVRYKKDFSPLSNALSNVLMMNPVSYYWKKEEFPERDFSSGKQIGFIAQELEKIYPEIVLTDKNGYKSVDYSRLTPILVEAIKELKAENDSLKTENFAIQDELKNLKLENGAIKTTNIDLSERVKKIELLIGTEANKSNKE